MNVTRIRNVLLCEMLFCYCRIHYRCIVRLLMSILQRPNSMPSAVHSLLFLPQHVMYSCYSNHTGAIASAARGKGRVVPLHGVKA
jgi:hypothetical protein